MLDFKELRKTYSNQLAGRLRNKKEPLDHIARVSNAFYANLLTPPIKRILSGCGDEGDIQALIDRTMSGGTAAAKKAKFGGGGAGAGAADSSASTQQFPSPSLVAGGTVSLPMPGLPLPTWLYPPQMQNQGGGALWSTQVQGSGPLPMCPPTALPPPAYQPPAVGGAFAPGFGMGAP